MNKKIFLPSPLTVQTPMSDQHNHMEDEVVQLKQTILQT